MFSLEGGETRTKQKGFIVVNRRTRQSLHTIYPLFTAVSHFDNFVVAINMCKKRWNEVYPSYEDEA